MVFKAKVNRESTRFLTYLSIMNKALPQTIKWLAILAGIILVWLLFRECNGNKPPEVTQIRIDTVWGKPKDSIVYKDKLVPYKVLIRQPGTTDTITEAELIFIPSDTTDYWSQKFYRDTVQADYGSIVIDDTVTQNALQGRSVRTSFNLPVVTKTVTVQAQKRNVLYIGGGALGNKQNLLYATEISLGIKFKNEVYWGIRGMVLTNNQPVYGVSVLLPIRTRK